MPNLESPLLGRDTNLSHFGGNSPMDRGNPAISVLSGAENDVESVAAHKSLLVQHIMDDRELNHEIKED